MSITASSNIWEGAEQAPSEEQVIAYLDDLRISGQHPYIAAPNAYTLTWPTQSSYTT